MNILSGIDEKPVKVVQREELQDLEERWILKTSILDEIRIAEQAVLEARTRYSEAYTDVITESTLEALRVTQDLFQDYYLSQSWWSRLKGWLRNVRNR
jgi:predicted NAD/FAD-dependent oxidoreductase